MKVTSIPFIVYEAKQTVKAEGSAKQPLGRSAFEGTHISPVHTASRNVIAVADAGTR